MGNGDLGGALRRGPSASKLVEENTIQESCSDGFVAGSASTSSAVVAESQLEAPVLTIDEEKAHCGLALLCAAIRDQREDSHGGGDLEDSTPNSRSALSQQRRNCKLLRQSAVIQFPENSIKRGEFRLQVELISASNLCKPQYCVDDFTTGLVSQSVKQFAAVYVIVGIGEEQKLNTRYAQNPEGANQVKFSEEKLLFHYHGETTLSVE